MLWKIGQEKASLAVLGVVAVVAVVGMLMLYGGNSGPTAALSAERGPPEGQGGGLVGCAPAECHQPSAGPACALQPLCTDPGTGKAGNPCGCYIGMVPFASGGVRCCANQQGQCPGPCGDVCAICL
ncbi:hypothetical protein HY642_00800 [Candidatus Woesearchaeota archaeon]|nr:hypothetical protein [Candidatus Woesearchaeota archaeon]